jgi:hypothetical protein
VGLPGDAVSSTGVEEPFAGWWSDTYGRRTPATVLDLELAAASPVVWTIGDQPIEFVTEADTVTIADTTIAVRWADDGAELCVTNGAGHAESRKISW